MGRPFKVIPTGTKFGRLTVVGVGERRGRNSTSRCRCICGTVKDVLNVCLKHDGTGTQSCGCLHRERASERVKLNPPRLKHGSSKTITYISWQGMVSRCCNNKDTNYPRYGGRGIKVCTRWSDPDMGFQNFLADMGERPSSAHSIDRIKGGNYEPGNCRWATRVQQNQNVGVKKSNSTGFKGVLNSHTRVRRPWGSAIRCDGKSFGLGFYATKEEAALAYNIASEELHGEFGYRNALPPIDRKTTRRVFKKVRQFLDKKR